MFFLLSSDVFITIRSALIVLSREPSPDSACDRVYAVSGRNKLVALCLSCLICAKGITGYLWIAHMRTNSAFIVCGVPWRVTHVILQRYDSRIYQSMRSGHAPQAGRFTCSSLHMRSVSYSVSRSVSWSPLPLLLMASPVRRFCIWYYHLVSVSQCRGYPVLVSIEDCRGGCDSILHHGNDPPNVGSVVYIFFECTSSSSSYLRIPNVFTLSPRQANSHSCAYNFALTCIVPPTHGIPLFSIHSV